MRWILGTIAGGVSVVLLAGSAVMLVPTDKIAALAAQQIEQKTGRSVEILGPVNARLWSGIGIDTGALRLANADWASRAPMIEAENLAISVPISALWGGELRITALDLQRPHLRLERRADGQGNWQNLSGADAAQSTTPWPQIDAKITDGVLEFTDHQRGLSRSIERLNAQLSLPASGGAAEFALKGRINGQPISLTAETVAMDQSPNIAPINARLAAVAGKARLDFQGDIALSPLRLDGALHMDMADPEALSRLMGREISPLPEGLGAKKLRLDGRVVVQHSGTVTLRDMVLAADDNHLRLSASVTELDAKPRIDATISAEAPVTILPVSSDQTETTAAQPPQWSERRIDLSPLRDLDGLVYIYAPSMQVGALQTGALRGQVALSQGKATVSITELAAYEGSATAKIVFNSQGRGSASADIAARDVALGPLLRDLGHEGLLDARMNGQVSLLTSFASISAMMHHLQGDGRVTLSEGRLSGIDLAALLHERDLAHRGQGKSTDFESVTSDFSIADGILRADHLTLQAAQLRAKGSGVIGIGGRMIDYRMMPEPLLGSDRIRIPLVITGPWAAPQFSLDWQAMVDPDRDAEKTREALAQSPDLAPSITTPLGAAAGDADHRAMGAEILRNLDRLMGGH